MTEFDSHAYKKPRRDGYEKVDADKVCLYCGVTEKDEKKFYRVDRMKKMKLLLDKFYIGTSRSEWLCQTHYQLNKQLNDRTSRIENGPQIKENETTATDPEPNQQTSQPPLATPSTAINTSTVSSLTSLTLPSKRTSIYMKFGLLYGGLMASYCFGRNPLINGSVMLLGVFLFLFLEGKKLGLFVELYLHIALRHVLFAVLIAVCGAAASVGLIGLLDKNTRTLFVSTLTFDSLGSVGDDWEVVFSMPYRVKTTLNVAITLLNFIMSPVYCYYQEAVFRRGTRSWTEALFRSILFGVMQYPLGQPVVACLVWSPIVGLFLSRHYFVTLRTTDGNVERTDRKSVV